MATPREISQSGSQNSGSGPDLGPEQQPDAVQGGAPSGPTLDADLPSIAVPGGAPAILTGYAPQRDQDALPAPGSSEGSGTAPEGVRR